MPPRLIVRHCVRYGRLRHCLFYGYATGVFSSRKLEQPIWYSVAFHTRFVGEFEDLFVQILMMVRSMGLLKLGTISLGGTKDQTNASRYKALSCEYANRIEAQLQAEVEQLMAMAEAAEVAAEVDVPAELKHRDDRLAVIRPAKVEMEARAAVRLEEEEKIREE